MKSKFLPPAQLGWDHFRVLLEVARTGTLVAAARRLGIDQSTASRRLAQVEFSTGGTLFKRNRQGLSLTPLGQEIFSRVERMEAALLEIQGFAGHGANLSGGVTIASMEGIGAMLITRAVSAICVKHPDLHINLVTTSSYVDIAKREADIFVGFFEPTANSLATERVGDICFHLYASPAYIEARNPHAGDGLDSDVFISHMDDPAYLPAARWLEEFTKDPRIGFRATSMFSQLFAAQEGLGIVMLPSYAKAETWGLKQVGDGRSLTVPVFVSVQQDLQFLPHIRLVYDSLVSFLGDVILNVAA